MGKIRIPFLPTKEVRKVKDLHFNIATYKIECNDDDNHGNYNLKQAIFSHYSSKSKIFLSEFPIFHVLNSNRMLAYLHIQIESKLRPPTPPAPKKRKRQGCIFKSRKTNTIITSNRAINSNSHQQATDQENSSLLYNSVFL